MQLTAAILAFAAGAIAVPAATSAATGPVATSSVSQPFNVLSIRSGTTLQYSPWGATKGSLLSGLKEQGAKCDKSGGNSATFEIRDGELFLYNKDKDTQKVWVDLSGMGETFRVVLKKKKKKKKNESQANHANCDIQAKE